MREREIDQRKFVDEKSDTDNESDVELDWNDHLDLISVHNYDDLESDLLSDSEDTAGSAEDFQWSPSLKKKQVLSLRILICYTPPHQLSFSNFS